MAEKKSQKSSKLEKMHFLKTQFEPFFFVSGEKNLGTGTRRSSATVGSVPKTNLEKIEEMAEEKRERRKNA